MADCRTRAIFSYNINYYCIEKKRENLSIISLFIKQPSYTVSHIAYVFPQTLLGAQGCDMYFVDMYK